MPPDDNFATQDTAAHANRYVIKGELGRGGMGAVYRALDTKTNHEVAFKVLLDTSAAQANTRFLREASAAGQLKHAGIVQVLDVGVREGKPFIVMELVEGESFSAFLKRKPEIRQVVRIVREVALAMAHAHAAGIIHRDLKPGNVLLDRAGRAKVADFGLVRILGAKSLTMTGQVLGTPGYMAPEQTAGEKRQHGPASDVYSIGAILYRSITGETPFQGHGVAQILFEMPRAPQEINATADGVLSALAMECLAREPEGRPTAAEVAERLDEYLSGRGGRRSRAPVFLGVGALLLAAGVGGGSLLLGPKKPPTPTAPVAPPPPTPSSAKTTPPKTPPKPAPARTTFDLEAVWKIDPRGRLEEATVMPAVDHDANGNEVGRGSALALDAVHHRLFVALTNENRIFVYKLTAENALVPGEPLAVIGQDDFELRQGYPVEKGFAAAYAIAYDASRDRLYVADMGRHRVLAFDTQELASGPSPIYVFGQVKQDGSINFSSTEPFFNVIGLKQPYGVAVSEDLVLCSSSDHDRVHVHTQVDVAEAIVARRYSQPSSYLGRVTGFQDGTRLAPGPETLNTPSGIAVSREWVFVADENNDRVVGYRLPLPEWNQSDRLGPAAEVVLGQNDFAGGAREKGSVPDRTSLRTPRTLAVDEVAGRLYVGDVGNHRVLVYDLAKVKGPPPVEAAFVIGQPDFGSNGDATTHGLSYPLALAVDGKNQRLFVGDIRTGAVTTLRTPAAK